MRPRRPIVEPTFSFVVESSKPPMRTLTRNPHRFGDMRDRYPLNPDPFNDQTTTMSSETSITVTHEDLLVGC
jgi:hypothetical protein